MAPAGVRTGWVCSVETCAENNKGYRTSSLVRSNFKFTKEGRPICTRCWSRSSLQKEKKDEAKVQS
jgi:hypothetical protein